MKVWKVTACLVFGIVLFLFGGFSAQGAGFSVEVTETEVGQGDTLEVDFTYDGTLGPVAAFRTEVQFDPTVLEYIRPQLGDQVAAGTTTTRAVSYTHLDVYKRQGIHRAIQHFFHKPDVSFSVHRANAAAIHIHFISQGFCQPQGK